MANRIIRLGPVFWILGAIAAPCITFALVFLGLAPWETLQVTCLLGWGGGLLIIIVAGRVGITREGVFSGSVFWASILGLLGMALNSMFVSMFFDLPFFAVYGSAVLLVYVLFAIYEETFMLGIRAAGCAANLPPWFTIMLEVGSFVAYHALAYPLDQFFWVMLLVGGRVIMSATSLYTGHSDPPFIVHIIWNVAAFFFGGI